LLIVYAIFIFFDYVTLISWQKLAKRRNWHPAAYIGPWAAAGLMMLIYIYVSWQRMAEPRMSYIDNVLFSVTMVWYLPKVVIAPVIGFKNLFSFIKRRVQKRSIKKRDDRLNMKKVTARRKFLQNAGWSAAGIPFVIVTNGIVRTTNDFRVNRVDLEILDLPKEHEGLRIVQFSDIHAGSFFTHKPFERAVKIANNLQPDIFIATGDFVNFNQKEIDLIFQDLSDVDATHGKFGCLGNHDHYMSDEDHRMLISKIEDTGVNLLINSNLINNINGIDFQIAGVDNSSYRHDFADFDAAFDRLDDSLPIYLLCHDPSNWDTDVVGRARADVTFSGHTHGGQVRIGAFGIGISGAQLVYRQWAGLYKNGDKQLYVNRGLGTVGPPLRVGIPPEITLFVLHRRDGNLENS
jgi:hypothetical protein